MLSSTALYWRAMRRVQRRSAAYRAAPSEAALALLREACRLANGLVP